MNRQSAANVVGNTYGCFEILEIKNNKVITRCNKCGHIFEKTIRALELLIRKPVNSCILCNAHTPGSRYGVIEVLGRGRYSFKIFCHNCNKESTVSNSTLTKYRRQKPNKCELCSERVYNPKRTHYIGEIIGCYKLVKPIKNNGWLVECLKCGKQQIMGIPNMKKTQAESCYFCNNPKAKDNPYAKRRVRYEDIDERMYHYYKSRILDQNDRGFKYKE